MKHTDEETLAMMALGEDTDPTVSLHLHECDTCRREYDTLRRVVSGMPTSTVPDGDLLTPPNDIWDSIAAELHIPSQPQSSVRDDDRPLSVTRPRTLRRASRFTVALAACAALLGAASGSAITWWATHTETNAPQTVADGKPLDSLRASSAGYASLTDQSGKRSLDITVKGLPETSGYFEVWLMDSSHTKLVSMGVLGPDGHATLPVPDNIDLSEYSVVDVSVQPYNGKPDHSGDSIVRGVYAG
ncbi:anti-sigma factor [Streptomyces chengbuensis]|uniref:anti-sigma factor n=1 Tax=Streptomyces TaxID=1883 RepID=UPI0025B2A3A3|nr:anti-sigma factor [Streptomyces sp. HUAS CB01]WJY54610.1 anti-sigma factor [Streptomyces sp. HUAS CB01]